MQLDLEQLLGNRFFAINWNALSTWCLCTTVKTSLVQQVYLNYRGHNLSNECTAPDLIQFVFMCVFFLLLGSSCGACWGWFARAFGRWALWEATASDPHVEMHYQTGWKNKQGDDGCSDLPAELKHWRKKKKKSCSKHFVWSQSRYLISLQRNCVFFNICYTHTWNVSYI